MKINGKQKAFVSREEYVIKTQINIKNKIIKLYTHKI